MEIMEERGKRATESLGWLTESSVMPKKHKAIVGVGAASIVDLKAQLYRTQEQARRDKESSTTSGAEFLRAKQRSLPHVLKNPGVESRAQRDKLELKAVNDGSVSYAALERKAELYDKLTRGELSDEEEKEKYCVDFFRKGFIQDEPKHTECLNTSNGAPQENEDFGVNKTSLNARLAGAGQTSAIIDNDAHKRFVREVHEEASEARQKATTVKVQRQEQEAARRERLRQAYLRKKLERLTSSKPTAGDS